MSTHSVYYFCIEKNLLGVKRHFFGRRKNEHYAGAVNLGLLTDEEADILARSTLHQFNGASSFEGFAENNLDTMKGRRFVVVSAPGGMYTKYAIESEKDADESTILQWNMLSESYFRSQHQDALRQNAQKGKPTNETLMALAVNLAEAIRQLVKGGANIKQLEEAFCCTPVAECNDSSQEILTQPSREFTVTRAEAIVGQKHSVTETSSVDSADTTKESAPSPQSKPTSKRPRSGTNTQKCESKYESIVEGFLNLSIEQVVTGKAQRLITKTEMASKIKKIPAFQNATPSTIEKGIGRTFAWKNRKKQLTEAWNEIEPGKTYLDRKKKNEPFREV